MRSALKRAVERALAKTGLADLRRRLGRNRAAILGYHNVVPQEHPRFGDSSLHLPIGEFRSQLDLLERHFDVVPLPHLFSENVRPSRPLVATIFVAPGLLGSPGFWWDLVAAKQPGSLSPELRTFALSELGGRQDAILEWALSKGQAKETMPDLYRPAEEGEVLSVAKTREVNLGSHTWNHVNLRSVPEKEARHELERPFEWLREVGFPSEVISYPYGSSDSRVQQLAGDAGYHAGLLIRGGVVSIPSILANPLSIARINIPRGLSLDGFLLRVSGLWPC